jgi:5,10-methylenetetrahydrofolate reductase
MTVAWLRKRSQEQACEIKRLKKCSAAQQKTDKDRIDEMTSTIRLRELELAAAKGSAAAHITCCRRAEDRLEHALDLYNDAIQTVQGLGGDWYRYEDDSSSKDTAVPPVLESPQASCGEPPGADVNEKVLPHKYPA